MNDLIEITPNTKKIGLRDCNGECENCTKENRAIFNCPRQSED